MSNQPISHAVHVCIATGQNAANLIPLLQYDAREVWILQTPTMTESAAHLALALRAPQRLVERKPFDDSTPAAMADSAEAIAEQLDGRQVVFHATGGTKLMVLALRDGLRLVEAGTGALDILYADTQHQHIDWLGARPRSEPMDDVLDLQKLLLVQGYRIAGDGRHDGALARAKTPGRARLTRQLGENTARYAAFFSALATLAAQAVEGRGAPHALAQQLHYAPGGQAAALLRAAAAAGMLQWDEDTEIQFPDTGAAAYFAGGWIEEFVLLKLDGMVKPSHFASNLQVISAGKGVPNELDAMLVHRNRALVIECKTGRQTNPVAALYKLAQLRERLGGSVSTALYLSAQVLRDEHRQRAAEYKVQVLCGDEVGRLPGWLRTWMSD